MPGMTAFSANLNKVALLRNTRETGRPDVLAAARACLAAGAHGITVHPRPDQRHTRPRDVTELRALTRQQGREFNIEGFPDEAFLALVCAVVPEQCTLVPDSPTQRTSDHGWDCGVHAETLRRVVGRLRANRIRVSIFLDPEPAQVALAAATGTDRIELYTEPYARAFAGSDRDAVLARYRATALAAAGAGLGVNAGHDLDLENLGPFLATVPDVLEVSIGHALVADALDFGFAGAVERYVRICLGHSNPRSAWPVTSLPETSRPQTAATSRPETAE
ncbi:pyridoxine 5'-phosphate synthase [Planctomycetota bacterium]|nr:pyridoxine 5'-phosphate synthase [Planctomycetota bacterium]